MLECSALRFRPPPPLPHFFTKLGTGMVILPTRALLKMPAANFERFWGNISASSDEDNEEDDEENEDEEDLQNQWTI